VIDEVQHRPELFPVLRVLADRPRRLAKFLVLGSASPALLRQSSESLAGRIAHAQLEGFSLAEVGGLWQALWLRGAYPRAFLAADDASSLRWRADLAKTYLERDLPQLGFGVPAATLRRFWAMLAHLHAQRLNSSELGRAFGVTDHSIRRYLEIMESTFMLRLLKPWHENLAKRQVKAPKVYLKDSGLLHLLLGIHGAGELAGHPKVGASWEGFGVEAVLRQLRPAAEECYYWGTQNGAELDLLLVRGRSRLGFEFKHNTAPQMTPSMRTALQDLKLDRLDVVHPGKETWAMAPRVRAVGIVRLLKDLRA